jgi:UDP-glucose 4-epimerase
MQFLITGGAGFLGTHLANALSRQGGFVRVLDDMSSGDPAGLDRDIHFTRGDVRDVPRLWSLLHGVDVVFHLAARVSLPASVLYPRDYNDVNVGGTVALLEACRDVSVRRVVLTSSATVYGAQAQQPVAEVAPVQPNVPYAVTKLAAENYLFTMGALSGFETVALRIFNAYGPGQPLPPVHTPVIPQMVNQLARDGSIVVFGNGTQSRDFVYVDDVVAALIATATAPRVDRRTINIGSGTEASINDVLRYLGQILGRTPNVLYNREASGGVPRLVADIRLAQDLLDFRPQVNLRDGLRRLVETGYAFTLPPKPNGSSASV